MGPSLPRVFQSSKYMHFTEGWRTKLPREKNWTPWVQLLLKGDPFQFFFVRKHITTCDFPVGGREVQTPCPSSGSAHVLVIMTCFQISSRSYSIDFSIYIFAINLITLNKFNEDASGAIQKIARKLSSVEFLGNETIIFTVNFSSMHINVH